MQTTMSISSKTQAGICHGGILLAAVLYDAPVCPAVPYRTPSLALEDNLLAAALSCASQCPAEPLPPHPPPHPPTSPPPQVIVMSRKPEFFSYNMPLYEVVTPDGLMRPVLAAKRGGLYCGGSARQVSRARGGVGWGALLQGQHRTSGAGRGGGVCAGEQSTVGV
jgi:hypothetical protein